MHAKREHILRYLRDHGRGTVEDLARVVELAPVTVRHHLHVLRDAGHIEAEAEILGRGRPRHVFRLTPSGAESLHGERSYVVLAADLIESLRDDDGTVPARVFRSMAARMAARAAPALDGMSMEARLDVITRLLTSKGVVVHCERDGDEYVIRELGCPYRSLSATHAEVCQLDLELIRLVSGAEVERDAWRGDGDLLCAFRVRADALAADTT